MRSAILTGCLWMLAAAAHAQDYGRVRSGDLLQWGRNGSVETLDRELTRHYGSSRDTVRAHQQALSAFTTPRGGTLLATRFTSLQTQCDPNSLVLNWAAVQQGGGADNYTIEQSADGIHWTEAGVVPATRSEAGEASYSFRYARNGRDGFFRIVARSVAGERVTSPVLESPCGNATMIQLAPNPVYSTATLNVGSPAAARVKVMVLDGSGALVQSREEGLLPGINSLSLDLGRLPAGAYTVVLSWRNGKQEVVPVMKR